MCVMPYRAIPVVSSDPDNPVKYRLAPYSPDWLPHVDYDAGLLDPSSGEVFPVYPVSCGKCLECLQLHKNQWTHRLLDEASVSQDTCFLTLTYSPDDPGFDGDLHPEHMTQFLKVLRERVRRSSGRFLRYFYCAEYGSNYKRPHYHVCLFGYRFDDARHYKVDRSGYSMQRSNELESIWTHGFSSILPVCMQTLSYVTKDMQKLLPPPRGMRKPFVRMSTHPGIGINGWNHDMSDGRLWHDGKSVLLPRYYLRKAMEAGYDVLPYYQAMQQRAGCSSLDEFCSRQEKVFKKERELLTKR